MTLTQTQTPALDAVAIDGDQPPSALWQDIATSPQFQQALARSVRDRLAGVPYHDAVGELLDAGVTAADGGLARLLADLALPDRQDAYWRALQTVAQIGQGTVTPLGRLGFETLADGPVAALDAAKQSLIIAVRIGTEFRDRRRDQREQVLKTLATLATAADVRVACSGLMARWLWSEHRDVLPRSFSDSCNAGPDTDVDTDALVTAAVDELDADRRPLAVLRTIADEPTGTVVYDALQTAHDDVSRARISQVLGTLEDLQLVERWGPRTDQRVDLLPAGANVVEWFDTEIGRQRTLDVSFSDTGQNSHSDVYSRPRGRGAPEDLRLDQAGEAAGDAPYRTRYADRPGHAGPAAAASAGDLVAVEAPLPDCDGAAGRHTRHVSYDADRDEAVVAVRATTPLQYMTSLATALASPRLLDAALPPERLESLDEGPIGLRQVRCIGALSSEAAADGETFRDALVEWGQNLEELTTKLNHEEYEDRNRFVGKILRDAHGLAGTIVHLLNAAGADIVRELRVPTLNSHQMAQLARTVAIGASIQSQYGAFAAYRQLFEGRHKKRKQVPDPRVDAADPFGNLIGSIVLRGPDAHRLGQHCEDQLAEPVPLHEDAPEFAVSVTVATPDRSATTAAANRMLKPKGMRATPEAVSMLESLAGDVYAVADALQRLPVEDEPRTIRLDDVRYALCQLDAGRLLTDAPPSLSQAVAALLATDTPLSQSELADAADVSTRSLRRHLDGLLALDIVCETDAGYRIALPRPDDKERGEIILPTPLDAGDDVQSVAFDLVLDLVDVDEAGRLGDPDDPLGAPFFGPKFDFEELQRAYPRARPYLQLALSLCDELAASGRTIQIGPEIEQASLQDSATGPGATAVD